MSEVTRPSLTAPEWNDRHGYSRPTRAQHDAVKVERDAAVAALGRVRALIEQAREHWQDDHRSITVADLERALDGA